MKKFLIGLVLFFVTSSVFAVDKVITLKGAGWSTFSTPKILSNISFSNTTGSGISFYTLNNGTWQSVTVGTGTIKPLEGYMVYNANSLNLDVELTYKNGINPQESLFTKNLNAGWNLLGVTSENKPFTTIGANTTMGIDFSDSTDLLGDLLGSGYNGIGENFSTFIGNLNVINMTSRYGKSYGIFMSQAGVYGGSQDLNNIVGTATISINSSTPSSLILTPSATEIELSRYTISASEDDLKLTDLYLYNTGSADLSSSIKSIGLYDAFGNKLAGGTVIGTGTVEFSIGTGSFVVGEGSNANLLVKASFNDLTDASQTNKTIKFFLNGARFVSNTSGNLALVNFNSTTSNTHLLVRSKPIVSIPVSATASTHTFNITADANNRITLAGTNFSLTNPAGTGGTFTLYKDFENAGNVIGTGTIDAAGNIAFGGFAPTEISAGTTKTFIFKVSASLQSAPVNAKRIFIVSDLSYTDMMNTGGDVTIGTISAYSNVGLPSIQSTYTY